MTRRALPSSILLLALVGCGREAPPPTGVTAVAPAARTASTPPPAPAPAPELVPTPPPPAPRAIEAPPPLGAACLANSAPNAAASARAVHRWVDAAGITHYSDQAPPRDAREHRVIDLRAPPPISVQASGYDANLPDELQRRAAADALGVQRVLHDALGVVSPPGIALRVVFVGDGEAYGRLIGNPALSASAGAYSTAQRTIFVRRQPQDEASFAVLRHEITHALVHESIGSLPTPVNEGLAEYFGRYRAAGLGGQIDVGAGRPAIVAAAPDGDGSDALVDLLARDGEVFYAMDADATARERRYLRAYALVAVLMRDAPGRAALADVLARQRADPCRAVAAERILDERYPGGLSALAGAWSGFMRDPPGDIRAY
ncbi:DUF4124 domain-containing protein [Dokdonella sp.]|uniref:DUF4124 domain-containing protein n=1 Tax=Dokdonella sp. TaxID=2291710 RepID=UPI001B10F4C8|nr:DUF4124 domain-containing protein [Dokdonella sp.]MBO9663089.1 DUF4124 domain-containing protein [Dokdonella sp.]